MSGSQPDRHWQAPPRWPFRVIKALLRPVARALTIRDWQGTQNLPATGGVILAVNHISVVDPIVIAHLLVDNGRIPRFMAKSELFDWPVVGQVMRATGQIPVNRNSPDASQSLLEAVRALRAGECVVIYPEGTVTREAGMWPMNGRTGVARLASLSGAPVLPVSQWGAHRILGRARRLRLLQGVSRHRISILVGPAVDLDTGNDEGDSMEALYEATDRVMAAITTQLEELRGQAAPVAPARSA